MDVRLLVMENCPSCSEAETVWRHVAKRERFELRVLDVAQPEGEDLCNRLNLRTFPAIVIDGALRAVGVQSPKQALELIAECRSS